MAADAERQRAVRAAIRWRRKAPHFPAKAKHVIFLFLNGGPSQVDTFDPKPMLDQVQRQADARRQSEDRAQDRQPAALAVRVPASTARAASRSARSFPKLGERIDDICVIRSMYTDRPNHEPSLFMMNCGDKLPGRPSMGSWLTYGLGTENQNLPGFVVLCPGLPVVGPQLWSSAFLPGVYQGTYIPNNETDAGQTDSVHPQQGDQAGRAAPPARSAGEAEPASDIERDGRGSATGSQHPVGWRSPSACRPRRRMSSISRKESEATRARYGDGDFGRGCLMARRLVERGVRMVQVYFGNGQPWDNHDDILIHRKLADRRTSRSRRCSRI